MIVDNRRDIGTHRYMQENAKVIVNTRYEFWVDGAMSGYKL